MICFSSSVKAEVPEIGQNATEFTPVNTGWSPFETVGIYCEGNNGVRAELERNNETHSTVQFGGYCNQFRRRDSKYAQAPKAPGRVCIRPGPA
jgi:hypothetical protein